MTTFKKIVAVFLLSNIKFRSAGPRPPPYDLTKNLFKIITIYLLLIF